jgi:predicted ArsR family transcriptional regulator
MHTTRRAILEYLRRTGDASVEDLAADTGLAPVTVRHHLGLLKSQDLVAFDAEVKGRGRPRHVYHLTPRGQALTADNPYQTLVMRMVDAAKEADRGAAEQLFTKLGERIAQDHAADLAGLPMEERLDAVVKMMSAEGFVVRWEAQPDGTYMVQELACPFETLGQVHPDICCMDQRLLQVAMNADVVRERWRLQGDPNCAFRIRVPLPGSDAAIAERL